MNNMQSRISIIIPVYNTGKRKLSACIRSVLKQSYKDFVLILVDDGSVDDSGTVCDRFAERDSRIRVIHQVNKGSVEARKTGVFSEEAQQAKYICFCDSDDTMPKDALEKLVNAAENEQADCVCGNTRRIYRNIALPERFSPPCFQIGRAESYTSREILEKLYVSCFGISNYPVSLCAKLYRTELITQAVDFAPIVQFMGEDLSVTLRALPETRRLVIIPDRIYNYRVGGGTSKFMPNMLDDFLSLYRFKKQMAEKYPMPQNTDYLMAVELKNIVLTWLEMCAVKGGYSKDTLRREIARVCSLDEMQNAVTQTDYAEKSPDGIRLAMQNGDVEQIEKFLHERISRGKLRRVVKSMLK